MKEIFRQFSINKILRFGYPSFYLLIRAMASKNNNNLSEYTIIICVLGLLFVYPLYKTTYWILIRRIANLFGVIPQIKWHSRIVNGIEGLSPKEKKQFSTVEMCSTCIHICLIGLDDNDAKMYAQVELQNTASHILYMTSFFSIVFIIVDYFFFSLNLNYFVELSLVVFMLVAGVMSDNNFADRRELVLLTNNSDRYKKILLELISAYKV